jgi:inhibitor of KinA
MNSEIMPYRIFPLGDTAVTVDFGNIIDETINRKVLTLFNRLSTLPIQGMTEAVPAYSSLTVYYDVFTTGKMIQADKTVYQFIADQLNERLQQTLPENDTASDLISIPVCYEREFAPDIEYLAKEKNISIDELISIHTSRPYRVYMLGFLPGFSYMGEVDDRIATSRKPQPVNVAAGSVGIAGKQTGIYPLVSPGGWQIIGRTPLKLFDKEKEEPVLLKAGDMVQFVSISKNEFENY